MKPSCLNLSAIIVFFCSSEIFAFDWRKFIDPFGVFQPLDPEASMTITEVIKYHGYPVEEYDVVTEDGYILKLHRIPRGKSKINIRRKRKPVLLTHGMWASSSCWVVNTPDKNLPYLLAERNYDVWMGNFRGNNFSRRHQHLSPDEKEFWMFSYAEMGKYDLPAMIEFVLEKTKFKQLHYIGHSMGTAAAFILLSIHPQYNDKIRSFHAMGPGARLDNVRSPILKTVIMFDKFVIPLIKNLFGYELLRPSKLTELLGRTICKWSATYWMCSNVFFLLAGNDAQQLDSARLPVYVHLFPAGSSTLTLEYFVQTSNAHRFQFFDHGRERNMELYHSEIPPLYNISLITTPVALYYGKNDWVTNPKNAEWLVQNLQNVALDYLVPFDKFNHLDFIWAKDVVPLVYEKMLETMDKLW